MIIQGCFTHGTSLGVLKATQLFHLTLPHRVGAMSIKWGSPHKLLWFSWRKGEIYCKSINVFIQSSKTNTPEYNPNSYSHILFIWPVISYSWVFGPLTSKQSGRKNRLKYKRLKESCGWVSWGPFFLTLGPTESMKKKILFDPKCVLFLPSGETFN